MKSESCWASVPLFNTTALSELLKCWFVERVPYMIHFSSYFKLWSYYWSTNSKEPLFPSLNGVLWMCASSMSTDHCSATNEHNARQFDQGQILAVSRTCTLVFIGGSEKNGPIQRCTQERRRRRGLNTDIKAHLYQSWQQTVWRTLKVYLKNWSNQWKNSFGKLKFALLHCQRIGAKGIGSSPVVMRTSDEEDHTYCRSCLCHHSQPL